MPTIQTRTDRSGHKRHRALVRRAGFPAVSRTFGRLQDARRWAAEIEAEMQAGRFSAAGGETRVADMIERYIATVCPTKKTGDRQAQQLGVWSAMVGDYQVGRLLPRHIAQARDELARKRGPATVVRYLAALSHVFTIAIKDWQLVESNPVRSIMWPKEPRGRVRFLSDAERVRLLEACRPVGLYPLVNIAMMTGCRRGELLGLTWKDVDLKRHRFILTETKNNERRQVPLMPAAFGIIQDLYLASRRRQPLVFGLSGAQVATRWRTAKARARIKDFRFHDLRHTCASYLAQHGATTQEIAEILGHKTLSMVKRYAHLTTAHSAKVLERMGAGVFGDAGL